MWVAATYDDLRRAGPDRGVRVRFVLDHYVIPWFGPQTSRVGDITYFMVREWLLTLVGRQRSEPRRPSGDAGGRRGLQVAPGALNPSGGRGGKGQRGHGSTTLDRRRTGRCLSRLPRIRPSARAGGGV
jgi:hypothetical protein